MNQFLQVVIGGLLQGCMYGLLGLGFSLVYRVTGAINLAQGAFCIAGALIATSVQEALHLSIVPAGIVAVALVAVLSAVLGGTTFLPALRRLPPGAIFILTAGLLTSLEGAALAIWGSRGYTLPAFSRERPFELAGLLFPPQGLWLFGVTILVTAGIAYLLSSTRLGRAFRACAENAMAAALMGIGVPRMQLLGFVLAAAIGALGGIVMGPLTSFQFDTGRLYTMLGFISAVIGGIGSPFGAVAGGLFLGVVTQFAAAYVSTLFSNAVGLLLLLVVLVWRPNGILSAGPARRQDVREEARVQRAVIRIGPRAGAGLAIVAALLALVWIPWVYGSSGAMMSITVAVIIAIGVVGLDLLMGFGGLVSLGQAGFMAIGGYTAGVLSVRYEVAPALALLLALVPSLLCALALSWTTMRLRGLYLAIATLAFSLLMDSLTAGLENVTGGPSGLVGIPSFSLGGFAFDTPLRGYFLAVGVLVVTLVILKAGLSSAFGRALMAVRADALAASALGIRVRRYRMAAFCISAVLGSVSGSLYAFFFHFLSPEMVGTPVSLQMLAMLVIGGEGTLFGPLIGVFLITLLPTFIEALDQYKTLGTGLLLILVTLYLPNGIFGGLAVLLSRKSVRSATPSSRDEALAA
jgi:branched-chain amino acid transport system permease protein